MSSYRAAEVNFLLFLSLRTSFFHVIITEGRIVNHASSKLLLGLPFVLLTQCTTDCIKTQKLNI